MAKKRKTTILGKDVIGIDETHNGFHLNHSYGTDLPLVTVGFLKPDYPGAQKANLKYERKGNVFRQEGGIPIEKLVKKASWYLNKNYSFYYHLITQRDSEKIPLYFLRARGIYYLVETFFSQFDLDENRAVVVLDKINDLGGEMSHIMELSSSFLKADGINVPFIYREHADVFNQATKTADRIGYYLLGLRFRGPKTKWPYRSKRVPFAPSRSTSSLEDSL